MTGMRSDIHTGTGEVAGAGLEVLVLDDQGRIVTDSQLER